MGLLKFLKFQLICGSRRVADRVDFVDADGVVASLPSKSKKQKMGKLVTFSREQIQKMTMDLSEVIGYGGFSMVYLAKCPKSSFARAAVKIQCSSERLNEAYRQELEILLHLRHPNIVKLIGHCNDAAEEGILVMEYVPNGNLHEALHKGEKTKAGLPWKKRMSIAFQLAQAIEYLHDKCSLPIVHGDIKSSNVLLDEHLNCKLCDFGSAKMGFSSLVNPSHPNRKTMVGSPGYTDPHYMRSGLASKKNDIYSYGVIVLELITGMEAIDPLHGQRLTMRAQPILQHVEIVTEMVDPRIRGEFKLQEAKVMAAIAALCLADSPMLRPCMSDILNNIRQRIPSISHSNKVRTSVNSVKAK